MSDNPVQFTRIRGMGRLPLLLEKAVGYDRAAHIFMDSGLTLALTDYPDAKMPLKAMVEIFEKSGLAAGDRSFGLRVGDDMGHRAYGMMTAYASQAPTLYGALSRLQISIRMHQPGARISMQQTGAGWLWSYAIPGFVPVSTGRHHADHVLPGFISLVRLYLGPEWLPRRVLVPYSDDGDRAELQNILPCDWLFSCPAIAVELPGSLINTARPVPAPGAASQAYITSCDILAEIARMECVDIADAIESVVQLRLLDDGRADIETVARLVGQSVRNLQRQLQLSGTTFRDIQQRARLSRAATLIIETPLSLTEIALIVGYSDPGNFSRAFRKRYSRTPLSLRRRA